MKKPSTCLQLLDLLPHVGPVERQLGEDPLEEPEAEEELVLVVRLEDGQADPEHLHQDVHLVVVRGPVLEPQALRGARAGEAAGLTGDRRGNPGSRLGGGSLGVRAASAPHVWI